MTGPAWHALKTSGSVLDPGFDLKPESDLWFAAFGHCADPGTGTRWNRESLPQGATTHLSRPALGAAGSATSAHAEQPVFRAGVNFVRVDVIVSARDGKPVLD